MALHGFEAYMWIRREALMDIIRSHAEKRGSEYRQGFCTTPIATAANGRNARSPVREVLSP